MDGTVVHLPAGVCLGWGVPGRNLRPPLRIPLSLSGPTDQTIYAFVLERATANGGDYALPQTAISCAMGFFPDGPETSGPEIGGEI